MKKYHLLLVNEYLFRMSYLFISFSEYSKMKI